MNGTFRKAFVPGAALLLGALLAAAPARALDGKAAFASLKQLAGSWQGHVEKADGPQAFARYELISNGTAVMETLFPGTEHEMRSIYFLEGNDLVLTHFCATGNQPKMKLDAAASTPTKLVFGFAGGTNLDPAKDGHIHSGRIELTGGGKMQSEWDYFKDGKQAGTHKIFLSREL
jgi:hypothetical protein